MTYSIRLPQPIEARLNNLSVQTGRHKSFYIKQAILAQLDDIEDIYLAESRLENIRAGLTKTIPLQEIITNYDLDN